MRTSGVVLLILPLMTGFIGCQKETSNLVDQQPQAKDGQASPQIVEAKQAEDQPADPGANARIAPREIPERTPPDFEAGLIDDAMLVRLFADSTFGGLDQNNRVLAYHLARAVLAGRDITFDQLHRDGLEVRNLIECILKNSVGRDPETESALSSYLKQLWIHGGFFDSYTGKKFMPGLSYEQFERAANAAHSAGADLDLAKGEPLEAKLSRLKRVLFDPHFQPVLRDPQPLLGQDVLATSHLNTYSRVRLRDLNGFQEAYPKNSRLIRIDGRLVEEIYRAGDKRRQIPPGRYKEELQKVIRRLQDAMTSARRAHRKILVSLVEFFRTGEAAAYDAACLGWRAKPEELEFYLGFTDTGIDPRNTKGMFSGLVGVVDRPNTSRLESIARHIQHFEDAMPWDAGSRKHWTSKPVAAAVQLLAATERASPLTGSGRELPASYAGQSEQPGKILVFSNVLEAQRMTIGTRVSNEFVHPADRKELAAKLEEITFIHASLANVLGSNMGKVPQKSPRRLKDAFPLLQALKAELTALWLLGDSKLVELGHLPGNDAALWAYRYLMAELLVEQSLISQADIRRPEVIARRILIRYLVEKAQVVKLEEVGGKTYPVVSDLAGCREALGRLLKRCHQIMVTADRPAARRLLKNYSRPPSWPALSQIGDRARKSGLRRLVAYLMPKLSPQRDATGKTSEVSISHKESFERQMMRYRLY